MENIVDIHRGIALSSGLKSELRLRDLSQAADYLRFAAVAYDWTSVYFPGGVQNTILWLTPEGIQQYLGIDRLEIAVPSSKMEIFEDPTNPQFYVGLMMRSDREAADLLAQAGPLIESGRVLIRPRRIVIALSGTEGDKRKWKTLDLSPESPFELWNVVAEDSEQPSLPATTGPLEANESELFEVTLPFLSRISFAELIKVLQDESDHIARCRLHLRELISKAKSEKGPKLPGYVNDVVRSEVDALSRRFKAVAKIHGLRAAGVAVGSVTLALVAASSGGWTQVITTLFSASGSLPLASEAAAYIQKRNDLIDDPHYFLWRLRSLRC